jgi:hypothetical protein
MRSENNGVPNVSCFRDVWPSHLPALVYPRESHPFDYAQGRLRSPWAQTGFIANSARNGAPFRLNPQFRPAPAEARHF